MEVTRHRARRCAFALVVLALLSACAAGRQTASGGRQTSPSGTPVVALDYAGFQSIEDMKAASNLVVLGKFVRVIRKSFEREFAYGGDARSQGLPVAVWEFQIEQVLAGTQSGATVKVVRFDSDRVQVEDQGPVIPDKAVVLFLGQSRAGYRASVAGDQSILDVSDNGRLSPRAAADPALQSQVRGLSGLADLVKLLS